MIFLSMVSRRARKVAYREIKRLIKLLSDNDIPYTYRMKYITLIRKLSMKFRVKPPRIYRLYICRRCKKPLLPGVNAIYRLSSRPKKAIYVKCLECGGSYRYIYGG